MNIQERIIVYLMKATKLPVRELTSTNSAFSKILVQTPHKGEVEISMHNKHIPFIFGSITETEKPIAQICYEIAKLEKEAKDYLLEKWLKEVNEKE